MNIIIKLILEPSHKTLGLPSNVKGMDLEISWMPWNRPFLHGRRHDGDGVAHVLHL